MKITLLSALAGVLFIAGCVSPGGHAARQAPPGQAPLPDARDLAEHPLDVLAMPQP